MSGVNIIKGKKLLRFTYDSDARPNVDGGVHANIELTIFPNEKEFSGNSISTRRRFHSVFR